jgi:DNA polymerase-3 subunit epsilon
VIALFYDTETQGLPLFNEPSEDPRQPHIVQLAACLIDLGTKARIATMNVIVRPDGWEIPDEVAAIHGITTERAMDVGVPESVALGMFLQLWRFRTRIAHNESFDARIIRIALMRFGTDGLHWSQSLASAPADVWKDSPAECTQALATPIMKLPPTAKMMAAGRNHHKSANLREAYQYFTGKELAGAHNAMVDVQACMAVWFAIKARAAEAT